MTKKNLKKVKCVFYFDLLINVDDINQTNLNGSNGGCL
jgi:hypothetical protein